MNVDIVRLFLCCVAIYVHSAAVSDKDECSDGSAQCEQGCTHIRSGHQESYQCFCGEGFVLNSDNISCTGEPHTLHSY